MSPVDQSVDAPRLSQFCPRGVCPGNVGDISDRGWAVAVLETTGFIGMARVSLSQWFLGMVLAFVVVA